MTGGGRGFVWRQPGHLEAFPRNTAGALGMLKTQSDLLKNALDFINREAESRPGQNRRPPGLFNSFRVLLPVACGGEV
jgi:hypothetical protein